LKTGTQLIDNERFDFDLDQSPKSKAAEEEEDEIFFGEMGLKEKCVSRIVDEEEKARPLTPLSNEDWAKICVEAHKMASIIQLGTVSPSKRRKRNDPEPEVVLNRTFEVEDSPVRLDLNFDMEEAFNLKIPKVQDTPNPLSSVELEKVQSSAKRKASTPSLSLKRRSLPTAPGSSSKLQQPTPNAGPATRATRRSLAAMVGKVGTKANPAEVRTEVGSSQFFFYVFFFFFRQVG
jgi:hypothetical protein